MKKFISSLSALTLLVATLLAIPVVAQTTGDTVIELKTSATAVNVGDEFGLDVILKNPGKAKVISVRTWLNYDSGILEGTAIDTKDTKFTLSAPGEDEFSASEGYVKIGRSNITGGATDEELKIATVKFKVKAATSATTQISPYDYQVTELGHVSVNIIEDGFPINILAKAPEAVTLTLGGFTGTTGGTDTTPVIDTTPVDIGGPSLPLPQRPTGLRIHSNSNVVELKWDKTEDENRAGYNLYYGRTSGNYSRMRPVGNVNSIKLDELAKGETYFFALTAHNALNQESDYSDEAGVIVGQSLSSTSPFEGFLEAYLARIPTQPQNGPLVGWAFAASVGLAGLMFMKKKKVIA
jgi:hypothetical protein